MVKVIDQDIPAWFYREYQRSLGFAHESKTGSGVFSVRKRPPYKLPHMRTNSGNSPSGAQLKVREAFKKCVDCFNNSPRKGGAIPPELGYRSKEWWYYESNSETWPDYVGKEKQKWNPEEEDAQQWKKSDGNYEPSNWFLQTDEPDFITFYDEMKNKYGFPWSAINDPDQICIKMNKIVINEIEYNLDQDTSITWTPGETAKARKGVCDDQSVLHYALTYKALTDIGWSAEQINERLAMIPNWCGGGGHVFNWWKQNNGATKIVENTLDPNQAPNVVGDLWYWGHWKSKSLIQRVNKDGAYNPRIIGNGVIYPLWYYNLFIHRSWQIFFDGGVPEWCMNPISGSLIEEKWKAITWDSSQSCAAIWATGLSFWAGATPSIVTPPIGRAEFVSTIKRTDEEPPFREVFIDMRRQKWQFDLTDDNIFDKTGLHIADITSAKFLIAVTVQDQPGNTIREFVTNDSILCPTESGNLTFGNVISYLGEEEVIFEIGGDEWDTVPDQPTCPEIDESKSKGYYVTSLKLVVG